MWLAVMLAGMLLVGFGCSNGAAVSPSRLTGPSSVVSPRPDQARPAAPQSSGPEATRQAKVFPSLGVEVDGDRKRIKNGEWVSLGNDLSAAVFVIPYPPSPETELHLFLTRRSAPVKGAQFKVSYDMEDMEHGARDRKFGREIEAGHYAVELDMFMWGDWVAEVVLSHPQFDVNFSVLLGVRAGR